jgi:general secretion pathway protein G
MKQSPQQGFTLVELMVVIVIVAVLASLVVVNIGGIDHRKVMQAREILLMDLQRIARESEDQSKILALVVHPSLEVNTYQYEVVEYQEANASATLLRPQSHPTWVSYTGIQPRELPSHVDLKIKSTQHHFDGATNITLLNEQAPQLIWLGNGEIKPVTIQFYYDQKPVGAEIQMDYMGKLHES